MNAALYISLFPQLIAGPIVRYNTINKQISKRIVTFEKFASGIRRFSIGLAKKVLIANYMGLIADEAFAAQDLTMTGAWIGVLAYSFQVYFDFSGYSDMAIGLGRIFGFKLLENFNYPYISKSIKEFWHRWHISLSTWFRDYLYIPLGGNRQGTFRTYLNLCIVFFLTGLWHGASWNFIVWGMLHGMFLIIERGEIGIWLSKRHMIIQRSYTLFIVLIAWVFFRAEDLTHSVVYLSAMADLSTILELPRFVNNYYMFFVPAIIGSMPLLNTIYDFIEKSNTTLFVNFGVIMKNVYAMILLLACTAVMVSSTYNPFIYFRF